MEAAFPTGAMAAIYDKKMPSIEKYLKHFRLVDSQAGAIFMINGKVVGLDVFGKPDTFSKVFKKLLESYALDDQILHVSIFARAGGRDTHPGDSRIEGFSRRSRNQRV